MVPAGTTAVEEGKQLLQPPIYRSLLEWRGAASISSSCGARPVYVLRSLPLSLSAQQTTAIQRHAGCVISNDNLQFVNRCSVCMSVVAMTVRKVYDFRCEAHPLMT